VKISVEPMSGFSFNVEKGTSEEIAGIRVEWQGVKGGKRVHTNIVMDSVQPPPTSSPSTRCSKAI
jgi:hypothetical protein